MAPNLARNLEWRFRANIQPWTSPTFSSAGAALNKTILIALSLIFFSTPLFAQYAPQDIMDTSNKRLLDYRRMFRDGRTPQPQELSGNWRGVNKGIVEVVGYRQFIKEITPTQAGLYGDNIQVEQVPARAVRANGWQPQFDSTTGQFSRKGKFAVQAPRGIGAFKHGAVFSYRKGGNRRSDPANLLVDKVVVLDNNHLLGRATANFGPIKIPLSYFVLERVQ